MSIDKKYYIVDKNVLPEVFLKVMEAKNLLESGKEKTVQDAVAKVGISRSAFYKYRESIFPLYENSRGKTVTLGISLNDASGLLSEILNTIARAGANILTINQNIPMNGIANVTITIETNYMKMDLGDLISRIESLSFVVQIKIIARE